LQNAFENKLLINLIINNLVILATINLINKLMAQLQNISRQKSEIKDLSEFHSLISEIFKYPTNEKEWEKYRLTDEQVAFFHEQGYLANTGGMAGR
jgi:hypothetical protein